MNDPEKHSLPLAGAQRPEAGVWVRHVWLRGHWLPDEQVQRPEVFAGCGVQDVVAETDSQLPVPHALLQPPQWLAFRST